MTLSSEDGQDIEQALAEVEQSLQTLKDRYTQVRLDEVEKARLEDRLGDLQQDYRRVPAPSLKQEIKQLQEKIDELEVALESKLFSWQGLREVFWQAVRFGGLGVILGWVLKSCAG